MSACTKEKNRKVKIQEHWMWSQETWKAHLSIQLWQPLSPSFLLCNGVESPSQV